MPIQVNRYLAYSDGMRVIESGKLSAQSPVTDGLLFTELDRYILSLCILFCVFELYQSVPWSVGKTYSLYR